ncbi:MAG: nitroreductase family protein [Actinomycetota bacterium]
METWDAIRARRNVRTYADTPIAPGDLNRVLEAARRSPSSMNEQPWDFVLLVDRAQLGRLAEVWRYGAHLAGAAAAIAFVAAATDDPEQRDTIQFDMGQAAMSVMLAAADLGVGSCHSAIGDQDLVRELLGIPADRECILLLSLGYPADRPLEPIEHPSRRAFDDVVHRDRW